MKRNRIINAVFMTMLCGMGTLTLLVPKQEYSISERRKLAQLMEMTPENVLNTDYMDSLDTWLSDHFIARDTWRSIYSFLSFNVMGKLETDGVHREGDVLFQSDAPLSQKNVDRFVSYLNGFSTMFTPDNHVYYAIIPDRNMFADPRISWNIDYDQLYACTEQINYTYIELRDVLHLEDYYRTDIHWRQECLTPVVNRLAQSMNLTVTDGYEETVLPGFKGSLASRYGGSIPAEDLVYLNSDIIENCEVYDPENPDITDVYPKQKTDSADMYDIFLGGASAWIEITNLSCTTDRELVVFRDSFASALIPLLIENYAKITLIDTRYISSSVWRNMISFDHQDVLFLYSTLLVNHSDSFKN
ncbi:MAG: DHHW family protein [Bulleidia sp.]